MDALKRYFRSPAAVAGLILLMVVIAMAISAGWLYPRDPLALAGRASRSAPTIPVAISPRKSSMAPASRF